MFTAQVARRVNGVLGPLNNTTRCHAVFAAELWRANRRTSSATSATIGAAKSPGMVVKKEPEGRCCESNAAEKVYVSVAGRRALGALRKEGGAAGTAVSGSR